MMHGKECLGPIKETIKSMFTGKGQSTESLPRIFVSAEDLSGEGVKFLDLFTELKLGNSKKEIRRLIQGGGAKINDEKISNENGILTAEDFADCNEVTLRAGKKRAGVVEMK